MKDNVHSSDIQWNASFRLVPSRFPPITLYENVADAADLEIVFAIEALGNPRIRDSTGDLSLVAPDQRICGVGTSVIMAAFTHLNPEGSRFSDGTHGVYYAASDLKTAVAEVAYHRTRFLIRTHEPAIDIDMRCYQVAVSALLCDVRGGKTARKRALHDPDSYAASQGYAARQRAEGRAGIVYDSVRRPGGECVALFTPRATIPPAIQACHITLRWNGTRMTEWYVKSNSHQL